MNIQKTRATNPRANGLERLVRWFGMISIVPALILPFYQQFLHGGRDAASISARSAAYAEAHMLGAVCAPGLDGFQFMIASTPGSTNCR